MPRIARRIFIIHGWGGSSKSGWMPWAKRELEKRGFEAHVPEMPDPDHPEIAPWVEKLREEVGRPDKNTILVGHSIGCQTILRYLETLSASQNVGKVILIAGWEKLYLNDPAEIPIAKPWLESPINHRTVKSRAASFTAVFSDNDPYVPYEENERIFRKNLEAEVILEKNMGHFNEEYGIKKLPILLKLLGRQEH